jgi:nitroreductase
MQGESEAFERLLESRYSCRGFLPQPVKRTLIEHMLEIAQRTPSWCNAQPWKVHIASGAATARLRAALVEAANSEPAAPDYPFPREYRGVYLERRRECGWQLYDSVGVRRGDREASARQGLENFRLFGAPHAAIVTTDEALGVYGVLDCGAWVNNFMLAAKGLGIASIAQAALASRPMAVRKFFGIGEDRRIVCGISFGYEDSRHPANQFRTRRARLDEVATWLDA